MRKFSVTTLGCKVNAYESEAYVQGLVDLGYSLVDFKENADIYIINTCAVTNTASAKSRQKINQAIKQNPDAFICVVGCYAQTAAEKLTEMENVDLVVGTNKKNELTQLIHEAITSKNVKKKSVVDASRTHNVFEALKFNKFQKQTRAFLKIQDGCNQFCSYCIIPYARGVERSLVMDAVVEQAKTLVANDHLEIVLAGIHTGRYGHDINTDLATLIKKMLAEVEGLKRIRISSIEIGEITDELLDLVSTNERLAKHLHIPLQAATDEVLQAMNRRYTLAEFEERMQYIRKRNPEISISTDIIAGFPSETRELHEQGLENVKRLGFTFMHVFPYSKRDNTEAAKLPNQLGNDEKKARANDLIAISNASYQAYKQTFIGKRVSVIFESYNNQQLFGHSSEYLPVFVEGSTDYLHTMQEVTIIDFKDGNLIGTF